MATLVKTNTYLQMRQDTILYESMKILYWPTVLPTNFFPLGQHDSEINASELNT